MSFFGPLIIERFGQEESSTTASALGSRFIPGAFLYGKGRARLAERAVQGAAFVEVSFCFCILAQLIVRIATAKVGTYFVGV